MGLSSALALIRGFVLALLLAPASFGTYALLVAIGTFAATLLSFGAVERTYKRFPRMFVDGHAGEALVEADRIAWLLARRALGVGAVAIAVLALVGRSEWIAGALCASGAALGVGLQSGYISVHRASGELVPLGLAAMARTLLALLFAAVGAVLASWPGAMAGEIVAALVGGWVSRAFVIRTVGRAQRAPARPLDPPQRELWLFVAMLIASIPVYLDRLVVSLVYGGSVLGSYGVLMLFVTGSFTLVTIVVQALGPQLVKLEHKGASLRSQLGLLLAWTAGVSLLVIIGMAVASLLLLHGPASTLGLKYSLTPGLLIATTALAMLQINPMFDWMLLSHNRERQVFVAALIYLTVLAAGVGAVIVTRGSLVHFLWIMSAAKMVQLMVELLFIATIPIERRRARRAQASD
jgi:O-antigen/teichoic acid export membrane protein